MKPLLSLILLLAPTPLIAQEIISPSEFAAMSEGKTLYFSRDGKPFGIEQYYKRHRSTWQYADGQCTDGVWQAQGDFICFVYRENPDKQCWQFIKTDKGFKARAQGAPAELDLELSKIDTTPLDCKGPAVGA